MPGNRVRRPWPMADATVSLMARLADRDDRGEAGAALERDDLAVADALPLVDVALVAAVARVHADEDARPPATRSQNGSNSGSANERGPWNPGTGAGRMRIDPRAALEDPLELLDARCRAIGRVMTGVAKMRSSKLNVHCSCIHWLRAWITAWVAMGSSRSRSSTRLASVGHIMARSMPSSSISSMRGSGAKNAGRRRDRLAHDLADGDLPSGLPILKYSSCAPGRARPCRRWGSGCSR